jgi:hypothetical protein
MTTATLLQEIQAPTVKQVLYTRIHRPEDYTADLLHYVATEVGVNPALMLRLKGIATTILKTWEDAATEYSTITYQDGKPVGVQTFYHITDYSSNKLFGLFSRLLMLLGVGKELRAEDIDISFVLLGGVLNIYGTAAGLKPDEIKALDRFRLVNSDFLTCNEFAKGRVCITNLETGKVDRLAMDPEAVLKIIGYANRFMTSVNKDKYSILPKSSPPQELARYRQLYEAIHGKKKGS